MKLTGKYGGDFGKQRLYGAFGYGVGGYVSVISLLLLVWYIPDGYGVGEGDTRPKG
jgi:hypothetical protein